MPDYRSLEGAINRNKSKANSLASPKSFPSLECLLLSDLERLAFPSKQLMLVSNALFPGAHRSFPVTWAGKCVLLTCTAADRILPCLVRFTVFKLSVLPLTAERARVEMQLSHTHRGQSPWAEWFTTPPICLTRCALPHSSSSCRRSPCPVFPFKLLQRPRVLTSAFLPGSQLGFSL